MVIPGHSADIYNRAPLKRITSTSNGDTLRPTFETTYPATQPPFELRLPSTQLLPLVHAQGRL